MQDLDHQQYDTVPVKRALGFYYTIAFKVALKGSVKGSIGVRLGFRV